MSNEKVEGIKMLTEKISDKKLQEYFNLHENIFGKDVQNGQQKQGLILLGYLINKITYKQRDKSRTFLDKINYDGIKKERLRLFINQVVEYLKIYDLLKYSQTILAEAQERLEDIEESTLTKQEITYYILLGNFLGAYIGKEGANKKQILEAKSVEIGGNENGN